ncbi:hypothetical protein GGQ59_000793 [Parvularcula dongshanensis]|uniref:Uncharacterized protein n=1 Tax=Parvularcula dongshanensis TaxID=1173995 RepID=A0A840I1Y3_9PROT|nr:hypothetical protein [Parvularcula dongshanensis]
MPETGNAPRSMNEESVQRHAYGYDPLEGISNGVCEVPDHATPIGELSAKVKTKKKRSP